MRLSSTSSVPEIAPSTFSTHLPSIKLATGSFYNLHLRNKQEQKMGKRKPYPSDRAPKTLEANAEQEKGTVFFYMPQEKPYDVFCQWHTNP
jgi:hypothetical protein